MEISIQAGPLAGGVGEPHHVVYELKEPIHSEQPVKLKVILHQIYIHGLTLGRFRLSLSSDKLPVRSIGVSDKIETILLREESQWTSEEKRELRETFLMDVPELVKEQETIRERRRAIPDYDVTLVMKERKPENSRDHTTSSSR